MSTLQILDLPAAASLDGSELVELQKAAGGAGSSEQAPIGAITPPGYIDGLKMVWVSGTALTVTSGAAYIQSLGRVLRVPSDIAKAGLTLSASTWYHVYLFLNGATPDIEIVTTAPAAPYNGAARSKTGDTSRRYLGSIRTDASGNILQFEQSGTTVWWLLNVGTDVPTRILNSGAATVKTNVSVSAICPISAVAAWINAINNSTSARLFFGNSDGSSFQNFAVSSGGARTTVPCSIGAAQSIAYYLDAAGGAAYLDVAGYIFER